MFIGIDTVTVARIARLVTHNKRQLRRIFTEHELSVCQRNGIYCPFRLATRFAAKEAAFKALSQYTNPPALLTMFRHTWVEGNAPPRLHVALYPELHTSVSLTHTQTQASAIVLISQSSCHNL